nr:hypothetical protein [Tanacetum cinerariifolium]
MAYSLSHTIDEIKALDEKLIDEDIVRQKAIMELAVQFDNACIDKEDMRKAYEKCNDILRENLIDDVGDDDDFKSAAWVSATNYVNTFGGTVTGCLGDVNNFLNNGKLALVVGIVKSCSPNMFGDLNVTIKDLSVTLIPSPSGVVHVSSSTRVEPSISNLNPVRIIPGLAGLVQQAKLLKEKDVGDDDDFKSAVWVSATNYVNTFGGTVTGCLGDVNKFLNIGKLVLVVGIVKSCSPNMLGDLNVTMKDLSGTIPRIIHHKVIGKGGYGKDIIVGAAMILTNVSVFSPTPSKHYLNITMRNVVEVFCKDIVLGNGSG